MSKYSARRTIFLSLSLTAIPIMSCPAQEPSYTLVSSTFFVEKPTAVPGHTLKKGAYSIEIVDHLRDRCILRVEDSDGKPVTTFIGLHNPDFAPFDALHHQGPIFWTGAPHGEAAMRAFSFPNGTTLEFAYPKAVAASLAKLNINSVPAIDPESEGRKPDPKLSPEDRQVVTLWMLKATRVGPDEVPAIEAKKFVAPPDAGAAGSQLATGNAGPAQPIQSAATIAKNEAPQDLSRIRPSAVREGQGRTRPAIKHLPQTASDLPLLLLVSSLFFAGATGLRLARRLS